MYSEKLNVLLVEDNPGDARLFKEMINEASGASFNLIFANSLTMGLEIIEKKELDAILLDLGLPESKGFDTFSKIRKKVSQVPIIILTGLDDEETAIKAVRSGAQEYLVKGDITGALLSRSIYYAIERKTTENALIESKKRIDELNEVLKVINKILRHDLLNHLATVSMALEVFENKKDEKYIKSAFKGVHRGIELIRQMRELESLVETGSRLGPINVRETIVSAMSPHQIEYLIEGGCKVLADQAFNSVITNIVGNAIKHGNTDRIDFKIFNKDRTCDIFISDYGAGISADFKEKIFEEGFSQGPNRGSGLGLYIVKKVVERYGGAIKVQENMPHGTTFVITLKKAL